MAKLVTILTKNVWEDWKGVDIYEKNDDYTQIEYDKIVVPYLNYAKSLPGIDWQKTQIIKGDTQLVTIRYFDTIEHAQLAEEKLGLNSDAPEIQNLLILNRAKSAARGYSYDRETKIIP